jgi:hypothetical protein
MQAADLYWVKVGEALTAPALATVVVPGVTAEIVQVPTPILRTVKTVPISKLTEASVGISLSSASDVAMHSSQIILSGDTLNQLPAAIRLARITVKTIKQNLFWAFFYNIIAIPLAACGFISPLAGALIMTGSDVVIVANSLRIKLARIGKR